MNCIKKFTIVRDKKNIKSYHCISKSTHLKKKDFFRTIIKIIKTLPPYAADFIGVKKL